MGPRTSSLTARYLLAVPAPLNKWYDDPAMAAAFEECAIDGAYNAHYDRPAVLELVGDVAGKRVLDACCGPGLYAAELRDRGGEVSGFDVSLAMLDLARRRLGPGVPLHRAVLGEHLPFDDDHFDVAVCALAIHYADDRRAAFSELFRVLRGGGSLVLSTQHPTVDWLRKGGSYFDVLVEVDTFRLDGRGEWEVRFWREPLSSLTDAATSVGFFIERIVEPLPSATIRERWPDRYEKLAHRPDFLLMRLRKP